MPADNPAVAVVTRGDGVDAWHTAAIAVVGPDGQVAQASGDPETVVFTRSSIKPFQALGLVLSGAAEALGLDSEELAIAASSHSGTDEHRSVVLRLLDKAGATVEKLGCGSHLPIGLRLANRYPQNGEDSDPLRHNCSGKHAGFLALSRKMNAPFASYLAADGPVQSLVRDSVARACGLESPELILGIDGCSAPNFGMPLSALARAMNNLARAPVDGNDFERALARIRDAMQRHPELVSGTGRFDCELARAFGPGIVSKGGAEAIHALGISDPPLGLAVKVLDGGERAVAPLCLAALDALGLLSKSVAQKLNHFVRPLVRNHRGLVTGEIVATVPLRVVGTSGGAST